jgi:hypothetical protein
LIALIINIHTLGRMLNRMQLASKRKSARQAVKLGALHAAGYD